MKPGRIRFFIRTAISAVLLSIVLFKVEWAKVGEVFRELDPGMAGSAALLFLPLIGLLALRWWVLLRQQQIEVTYRQILLTTWAAQFFNSVLPGSIGGDALKLLEIYKLAPEQKTAGTASVVVDRLTALAALVLFGGIALLFYTPQFSFLQPDWLSKNRFWIAVGALFMVLAGGWACVAAGERISPVLRRFADALWLFVVRPAGVLAALVLAAAVHLCGFLIFYFFARALGTQITFTQVLFILPVVLFLVMLPITVNGHGLREALLIGLFQQMQIGSSNGAPLPGLVVALSVLLVSSDMLSSLPGGLWYLLRRR